MDVTTWEDLAAKIAEMTDEQRNQPIQCVNPTPNEDDVQEMLPGIAIATVDEMGFCRCRSTHSNKYEPGDVVLLMDHNPFAEDGAVAYDWTDGEDDTPIYGEGGKTDVAEQSSPQAIEDRKANGGFAAHAIATIKRRADLI